MRFDMNQEKVLHDIIVNEADAILPRISPGALDSTTGIVFEAFLETLAEKGVISLTPIGAYTSYSDLTKMIELDSSCLGLDNSVLYDNVAELYEHFAQTLTTGPRVIKSATSQKGKNVWLVQQMEEGEVNDQSKVKCIEAEANDAMTGSLDVFLRRYKNGVHSKDKPILDTAYLPGVADGEYKITMLHRTPISIYKTVPAKIETPFSCKLQAGARPHKIDLVDGEALVAELLENMPEIHRRFGIDKQLPMLWSAELIRYTNEEGKPATFLNELSCSCVGFTEALTRIDEVASEVVNFIVERKSLHKRMVIIKNKENAGEDDLAIVREHLEGYGWETEEVVFNQEEGEVDDLFIKINGSYDAYFDRFDHRLLKDERAYLEMLKSLGAHGIVGLPSPEMSDAFCGKDIGFKLKDTPFGEKDTKIFFSLQTLQEDLCKKLKQGPRVVKPIFCEGGEGIWKINAMEAPEITESTIVKCTAATDNHIEELALGEFIMEAYGGYFEQDGEEVEHVLVSQKHLDRVAEGSLRVLMINRTPVNVAQRVPKVGQDRFSTTVLSGAQVKTYPPADWKPLLRSFQRSLDEMDNLLGPFPSMPPVWTADFILGDPDESGADTYVLSGMDCKSIRFSSNLEMSRMIGSATRTMVCHANAE